MSKHESAAYCKGVEALAIIDRSWPTLRKLVAEGLVGVLEIPGSPPRYCRADLVRIREAGVRPARRRVELAGT